MTTKNEMSNFEDELLKKMRIKEAWKNISSDSNDFYWTANLIEKHKNKINWEELSENRNVGWSIELLEKYRFSVNWDAVSKSIFDNPRRYRSEKISIQINEELLSKFENSWNWNILSKHICSVTDELLETFANQLNWKEIIDNRDIFWDIARYEKFKKYIPLYDIDNFTNSHLWSELVDVEEKILEGKLLSDS